jgi:prolyl oligopeptidase
MAPTPRLPRRTTLASTAAAARLAAAAALLSACGPAHQTPAGSTATGATAAAAAAASGAASSSTPPGAPAAPTAPPVAARRPVTDTYHGVAIEDPYRWLEADEPEVAAWSDGQNAYARGVLDRLPQLPAVRDRLTAIFRAEIVGHGGFRVGGSRLFALRHKPPREQPELVVMDDPAAPQAARVVLDATALPGGALNAIDWYEPSPDGTLVAVSLSQGGSEAGDVHILRVDGGGEAEPPIPNVQRGTAGGALAWTPDGKGFYYTRYPVAGERPAPDLDFYQQLWFHSLGTAATADRYELGKELPRVAEIQLQVDAGSGRLLATVQDGDGGTFRHYLREADGKWRQLSDWADGIVAMVFGPPGSDALFLVSRAGAPRGKVLRMPVTARRASRGTVTAVIPEGPDALITDFYSETALTFAGGRIHALYQTGGPSELRVFTLSGKPVKAAAAPPVSATSDIVAFGEAILFHAMSFTTPGAWYRYDGATGTAAELGGLSGKPPVDLGGYEVVRETAISKDGTKIPFSIVWPRGAPRDGTVPCLVTGYGGFASSEEPHFLSPFAPLLERGVCYVSTNLRGGGEFGEAWHKAGMLTRKQNVFDDFTAVVNTLIERNYTRSERLAILGGSNGGLLMGAVLTQHPDLVHAVVASVGVYDSLRNELTPNGAFNVSEFGSVKDRAQFQALRAYSPYHHVVAGTSYPAVLFTAGANDPRVAPCIRARWWPRSRRQTPGPGRSCCGPAAAPGMASTRA